MTTTAPGLGGRGVLQWERLMAETRYGRYADEIETHMVEYVLGERSTPGALLDIGCEGGRRSKVFAERGWQVTAVDVDVAALQMCQRRIAKARCVLTRPDEQRLIANDDSFDLVLCIEVGPVVHQPWASAEFSRVLKTGGHMVGVSWNKSSWRGFLYHRSPRLRVTGANPLVGYPIRYSEFRRDMIAKGFSFEKELGYAWGPFRRNSNSVLMAVWKTIERYSGLQKLVGSAPMVAFVCKKT